MAKKTSRAASNRGNNAGEAGDVEDTPPSEADLESSPDNIARPRARAIIELSSEETELKGELKVHYEWLTAPGNGWISGAFHNDS